MARCLVFVAPLQRSANLETIVVGRRSRACPVLVAVRHLWGSASDGLMKGVLVSSGERWVTLRSR